MIYDCNSVWWLNWKGLVFVNAKQNVNGRDGFNRSRYGMCNPKANDFNTKRTVVHISLKWNFFTKTILWYPLLMYSDHLLLKCADYSIQLTIHLFHNHSHSCTMLFLLFFFYFTIKNGILYLQLDAILCLKMSDLLRNNLSRFFSFFFSYNVDVLLLFYSS